MAVDYIDTNYTIHDFNNIVQANKAADIVFRFLYKYETEDDVPITFEKPILDCQEDTVFTFNWSMYASPLYGGGGLTRNEVDTTSYNQYWVDVYTMLTGKPLTLALPTNKYTAGSNNNFQIMGFCKIKELKLLFPVYKRLGNVTKDFLEMLPEDDNPDCVYLKEGNYYSVNLGLKMLPMKITILPFSSSDRIPEFGNETYFSKCELINEFERKHLGVIYKRTGVYSDEVDRDQLIIHYGNFKLSGTFDCIFYEPIIGDKKIFVNNTYDRVYNRELHEGEKYWFISYNLVNFSFLKKFTFNWSTYAPKEAYGGEIPFEQLESALYNEKWVQRYSPETQGFPTLLASPTLKPEFEKGENNYQTIGCIEIDDLQLFIPVYKKLGKIENKEDFNLTDEDTTLDGRVLKNGNPYVFVKCFSKVNLLVEILDTTKIKIDNKFYYFTKIKLTTFTGSHYYSSNALETLLPDSYETIEREYYIVHYGNFKVTGKYSCILYKPEFTNLVVFSDYFYDNNIDRIYREGETYYYNVEGFIPCVSETFYKVKKNFLRCLFFEKTFNWSVYAKKLLGGAEIDPVKYETLDYNVEEVNSYRQLDGKPTVMSPISNKYISGSENNYQIACYIWVRDFELLIPVYKKLGNVTKASLNMSAQDDDPDARVFINGNKYAVFNGFNFKELQADISSISQQILDLGTNVFRKRIWLTYFNETSYLSPNSMETLIPETYDSVVKEFYMFHHGNFNLWDKYKCYLIEPIYKIITFNTTYYDPFTGRTYNEGDKYYFHIPPRIPQFYNPVKNITDTAMLEFMDNTTDYNNCGLVGSFDYDSVEPIDEDYQCKEIKRVVGKGIVDFFGDGYGFALWTFNGTPFEVTGTFSEKFKGIQIYTEGKFGQALSFDGNTCIMSDIKVYPYNAISISFWFRKSIPFSSEECFFSICKDDGYKYFVLALYDGSEYFSLYQDNVKQYGFGYNNLILDGDWHHVVICSNGYLYFDSIAITNQGINLDMREITLGLTIGAFRSSKFNTEAYYKGDLEQFRIFNKILVNEDVKKLYEEKGNVKYYYIKNNYYRKNTIYDGR